jgi:hypothetical protein
MSESEGGDLVGGDAGYGAVGGHDDVTYGGPVLSPPFRLTDDETGVPPVDHGDPSERPWHGSDSPLEALFQHFSAELAKVWSHIGQSAELDPAVAAPEPAASVATTVEPGAE